MEESKVFFDYYVKQAGAGLTDIGELYSNPWIVQNGSGIGAVYSSFAVQHGQGFGSFFGALVRFLKPVFKSGLNTEFNYF